MKIFIGMETSGTARRAFSAIGHHVISCDILSAEDGVGAHRLFTESSHMCCDVFAALDWLKSQGWWPDFALFHPTCTFHTISAAWAFGPGPYHQKVKPETLVGVARHDARERAENDVRRIEALPIKCKVVENPVGTLSTRWKKPTQIIQPYQFGDDASKKTCLWIDGLPPLKPTAYFPPRFVNGLPRWSNQSENGQNRLGPSAERWKERSRSYPGIIRAMRDQWLAPGPGRQMESTATPIQACN